MNLSNDQDVVEKVLDWLVDDEEKRKEARSQILKLKSKQDQVLLLNNVISLRLADMCLSLFPENSAVELSVLSMIERFYGKNNPRAILQIIRTAILLKDVHLRLKLLNRAHSMAQISLPCLSLLGLEQSIGTKKENQEHPTLMKVIESLIEDIEAAIKCSVSIKNKQNKWKSETNSVVKQFKNPHSSLFNRFNGVRHPVTLNRLNSQNKLRTNPCRWFICY